MARPAKRFPDVGRINVHMGGARAKELSNILRSHKGFEDLVAELDGIRQLNDMQDKGIGVTATYLTLFLYSAGFVEGEAQLREEGLTSTPQAALATESSTPRKQAAPVAAQRRKKARA